MLGWGRSRYTIAQVLLSIWCFIIESYLSWPKLHSPSDGGVGRRWLETHSLPVCRLDILRRWRTRILQYKQCYFGCKNPVHCTKLHQLAYGFKYSAIMVLLTRVFVIFASLYVLKRSRFHKFWCSVSKKKPKSRSKFRYFV